MFDLKYALPKSDVCVRLESILSNRLQSRLLKVPKKVLFSLVIKGQSRRKWVADSISWPQLREGLIESLKLCLNLCSLKWLKPIRSRAISLILLGLWQLQTELGAGLMSWRIFFLIIDKLSELQRKCFFH